MDWVWETLGIVVVPDLVFGFFIPRYRPFGYKNNNNKNINSFNSNNIIIINKNNSNNNDNINYYYSYYYPDWKTVKFCKILYVI